MIVRSNDPLFFGNLDGVYSYYSSYRLLARYARRMVLELGFHFVYPFFYSEWKTHLKDSEEIILFDSDIGDASVVTKYIRKVSPSIKIIFWYWNPVKRGDGALEDRNIDEIWTYNRFDAKKYGLKYNPQFYHPALTYTNPVIETDLIFLGRDKGRQGIVKELVENAEMQGLKCDVILVRTKKDMIEYEEYLRRVFRSKCIVDIVPNQKCGLTLRPLEALFYKKKLITNYEDIVSYDFYDKENIFILGKDDMNKLADFVNSPYKEIDKKVVDFYSYERWLERIEKGEDVKP